jgi:hypothetical protein
MAMTGKYVVYTALFGNYDKLHEPPNRACSNRVSFVCFTDQKNISSKKWNIIHIDSTDKSLSDLNRFYKMHPHLLFKEHQYSIYIDSNIRIKSSLDNFIDKFIAHDINMAAPKHTINDCIYDEIDYCLNLNKINDEERNILLNRYTNENFPKQLGLTENNIIFRKHSDVKIIELMESWWGEYLRGPKRDQLSLFYVSWKLGVPIHQFSENSRLNNKFFSVYIHCNNYGFLTNICANIDLKKNSSNFFYIAHILLRKLRNIHRYIC